MSIKRSIVFILVAVLFASVCFTTAPNAAPPEGEEIGKIGHTNSSNGSRLRSQASTDSSTLATLPNGSRVEVFVQVTGSDVGGVNTWYYVRSVSLNWKVMSIRRSWI